MAVDMNKIAGDFMHKPIPGISLTTEPGSVPWERPPKYVKLGDVVDYYSDRITSEEVLPDVVKTIKGNMPLMTIAEGMVRLGVMEGIHSIDMAMIIKPIIVELLISMAELHDIGFVVESEDLIKQSIIDPDVVDRVISETTRKIANEAEEQPAKGLVARRSK